MGGGSGEIPPLENKGVVPEKNWVTYMYLFFICCPGLPSIESNGTVELALAC